MAGDTRVTATVGPRCTVQVDGKHRGPGEIVRLPKPEVIRLRALGFLLPIGVAAEDAEPPAV